MKFGYATTIGNFDGLHLGHVALIEKIKTNAKKMNLNPDDVYAEMVKGILPGIQLVPSGVWALGRAQNNKCAYIFAG